MRGRALVLISLAAGCAFPSLRFREGEGDAGDAVAESAVEVTRDASSESAVDAVSDARTSDVTAPVRAEFIASPSCPSAGSVECQRVRVAGATFELGEVVSGSAPVQPGITVDGFIIDATEVTLARFRRFVDAANAGTLPERFVARYPTTPPTEITVERASLPDALADSGLQCNWTPMVRNAMREALPINCVRWDVALAFCVWDGGRLPTEAEFELVARHAIGPAGSAWPWGDEPPSCARAQWQAMPANPRCTGDDTQPTRHVGSLPAGARGPLFDLAGNVAEWCADEYQPFATPATANRCWGLGPQRDPLCQGTSVGERSARGGSWFDDDATGVTLRGSARVRAGSHGTSAQRGMRCVRPLAP